MLAAPEAQVRPNSALNLALGSDMGLGAIRATLNGLPNEIAAQHQQQLAARRAEVGEGFGPNNPLQSTQEAIAAGWKRAIARVNANR